MRPASLLLLVGLLPAVAVADPADIASPVAAPAPSSPIGAPPTDVAPAATVVAPASVSHANPRLKVSFRNFNIQNEGSGQVPMRGAQLDVYPLSRRWVRMGIEAEGGVGDATVAGAAAHLYYGLAGVTAGIQYPARITPFAEARLAGGVMGGTLNGSIPLGGGASLNLQNQQAATLMYVGGIDAGVELYTVGRAYLSASVGWARAVYQGPDYAAMYANPSGGMQTHAVSADAFTFKLGVGI